MERQRWEFRLSNFEFDNTHFYPQRGPLLLNLGDLLQGSHGVGLGDVKERWGMDQVLMESLTCVHVVLRWNIMKQDEMHPEKKNKTGQNILMQQISEKFKMMSSFYNVDCQ